MPQAPDDDAMESMGGKGERADDVAALWRRLAARFVDLNGQKAYDNWLSWADPKGGSGETLVLALPNNFLRDWVRSNYGGQLTELLQLEESSLRDIKWVVEGAEARRESAAAGGARKAPEARPDRLSTPLDERFTFGSFVVGRPNQFCYAAARKVAELQRVEFNPLFLYSGVGLGKTHLMHAIAWEAKRRKPDIRVVYLSAERFMYAFINALRYDNIMQFKEEVRAVDLLLIDDVHFLVGKGSTQEEFFHLFNYLVDNGRQIVLSADRAPGEIEGLEERVKSRLAWGLVADIHPTDFELRLSILEAKVQRLPQIAVPDEVLRFLAANITANVRELEGALNRIAAHAQLMHVPITLDLVRDVLQDLLRLSQRKITIEAIQKTVASHYNIRVSDMMSRRRDKMIVRPRQLAMYLSKLLTSRSLPHIGRAFDGRDHTTVMYAVSRIDALLKTDADLESDVRMIRRQLEG